MSDEPVAAPMPASVQQRIEAGAFLLLDKPRGPSSHQVTAWARDLVGVDRAGHAGTLDPNVSGLLWIGVGPALKLLPLLLEFPKRYVGVIEFHAPVEPKELARVLTEFTGPIYQTPPVRSAVKRERRRRTIHRLELLEREKTTALVDVVCDSGTYIRTLAVDVGEALGVGGHLAELRRTGTGPFHDTDSITLAALADAAAAARDGAPARLESVLHPIEEVWKEFPAIELKDAAASAVAHGAGLARGGISGIRAPFSEGATVVLVDRANRLVAFGSALADAASFREKKDGWVVRPERVFATPAAYPPAWRRSTSPASPRE